MVIYVNKIVSVKVFKSKIYTGTLEFFTEREANWYRKFRPEGVYETDADLFDFRLWKKTFGPAKNMDNLNLTLKHNNCLYYLPYVIIRTTDGIAEFLYFSTVEKLDDWLDKLDKNTKPTIII